MGSILLTYICKDYLTTLRLKQIDWALFYLVSGGSGTSTRQFVSYVSKQSGVGLRFSIRHWNITVVQSNLAIRNGLIRNKLVIRNHFLWPICHLLHKDKGTILGQPKSFLLPSSTAHMFFSFILQFHIREWLLNPEHYDFFTMQLFLQDWLEPKSL